MILTGKCREDFIDWFSDFSEQHHVKLVKT